MPAGVSAGIFVFTRLRCIASCKLATCVLACGISQLFSESTAMARNSQTDRDFAKKLVSEVQRQPILYDPSQPDYKDRGKVELEWAIVAAALDVSADFARKKWQNLRGSYSRSLASRKLPSGSGAKRPIRFYLEEQMGFLKGYMTHDTLVGNYGAVPGGSEGEATTASTSTDQEPALTAISSLAAMSETSEPDTDSTGSRPATPTPPPMKKKRVEHPVEDAFMKFLASKATPSTPADPDLNYFKGILPQVKELNHRNKRIFFNNVSNMLFGMLESQDGAQETVTYI